MRAKALAWFRALPRQPLVAGVARRVYPLLESTPLGRRLLGLVLGFLEEAESFYTFPQDPLRWRFALVLRLFERETMEYLRSRVEPGMTVVDVGANVGYHARLFAESVGSGGRVVALEPNPEVYPILRRNLNRFPQALALQLAASTVQGPVVLQVPKRITGGARITTAPSQKSFEDSFSQHVVEAKPLNAILSELHLQRVDLLKIDAEGAEVDILRSLGNALETVHEVVCELLPSNLQAFGETPENLLAVLSSGGFRRFAIIDLHVDGRLQTRPWLWLSAAEVMGLVATLPPDFGANLVARR